VEAAHVLESDERGLVARCKLRDADAFNQVVLRYQERIFNVLVRMTGDHQIALDLCQETFLKAYRAIATFEERSALSTWLYRIAANLCLSHRRYKRRRPETSLDGGAPSPDADPPHHDLPDGSLDPGESVEVRERRERVRRTIDELDPEFRMVVVLRDLEGLSYEEIAESLGCPVGTVRSRLHRARLELKEKLKHVL
jgi:RNA polymerase sigma-70 factor (ECF subfamily)